MKDNLSQALEAAMRAEADHCLAEAIQPQDMARMSLAYRLSSLREHRRKLVYPESSGFLRRAMADAAPAINAVVSDAIRKSIGRRR